MLDDDDGPDLDQLLDLATPWCLMVAATLRLPDLIAAGHHDIADLAAAAGCDRDALHAVLGHLVSKGVFQQQAPGHFATNRATERLQDRFLNLDGIGGRMGWDAIGTMVDVGGGTGAMLASLLRRHPHVHGILVDLPGTIARAAERTEKITLRGQSFFDPLPAGADLYLLKSVLNDWPDQETVAILRNCAQAAKAKAKPTGTIAVLGGVAPDDAPRSLGIDMLVAGGKTSTITQFTELGRQAGLDVIAARTQPSGRYVVECRPHEGGAR